MGGVRARNHWQSAEGGETTMVWARKNGAVIMRNAGEMTRLTDFSALHQRIMNILRSHS